MKIVNLSASEQCNCCYECLYYGLKPFTAYSFKIIMEIASTNSRRRQKTFVFTSGVFRLHETYTPLNLCYKHRTVASLNKMLLQIHASL